MVKISTAAHMQKLQELMHKNHYYQATYNYYEKVKNLWGVATKQHFLIQGFKFSKNINKHLNQIAIHADIIAGLNVLDCGCGFGRLIKYLNKKYPGVYSGITLNDYHIKHRQSENVYKGNFEDLSSIKTDSIDRVLFIESFSHAFNKEAVLREVKRVLRKNGKVFILDLSISNEDYFNLIKDRSKYKDHINFYGDMPVCGEYMLNLIRKLDFKIYDFKERIYNKVVMDKYVKDKIILHTINTFYNYYIFTK
jgi:ubiquinone/menaquinone biosynthesis C-methylase UbiE